MRKKIVAGNWKMNKTVSGSIALASEVVRHLAASPLPCEVVLAPSFLSLDAVGEVLKSSNLKLSAQNCHFEDDGAYTGEVSAAMLRSVRCEYVILGHSERRHLFGEKNETVNRKVKKALSADLRVILCVGETLQERDDDGITEKVLNAQLSESLAGVSAEAMQSIAVAYEPVWAIGTGLTATPVQAEAVHAHIRRFIADLYTPAVAASLTVQYGGSVKASNAKALFSMPNIDGGLIGGASLTAEEFVAIVRSV